MSEAEDSSLRIVSVSIRNFRGIKQLEWSPSPGLNCLIGPGDVGKTTILDAIETALSPRYGFIGNDSDLHKCDEANHPEIKITVANLPEEFLTDNKYGLHLRGWSKSENLIRDEPHEDDLKVITVRASLDPESLEWNWGIFNDRIDPDDPPRFGLKDARRITPNRLGIYADRHLTWSRNSALSRLENGPETSSLLTKAMRSARSSFCAGDRTSFDEATEIAETVSKQFLVPKLSKLEAQLDIQSGAIASGAVSLHDGDLPLRSLGSGSSRLMVAGLQHSNATAAIALIDEIELGLEPYRIMRLLRFLQTGALLERQPDEDAYEPPPQVILTTHSPVAVCELKVGELHCVRNTEGVVSVLNVEQASETSDEAQRHVRSSPAAFLAPRIIVGEGRTECGFLRGLDQAWYENGHESFAFNGVVAVDGTGKDSALKLAIHLLKLGYRCLVLLDTDQPVSKVDTNKVNELGGTIKQWPDECDIERRLFLDLPWLSVKRLISYVIKQGDQGRVLANVRTVDPSWKDFTVCDIDALEDTYENRDKLARAATLKTTTDKGSKIDKSWFKTMERGEFLGEIVVKNLVNAKETPLALIVQEIRAWVDA